MHIDQLKKVTSLSSEETSSPLNLKSLQHNQKTTESLLLTLCFILKVTQLTEKIKKNLMKLDMMILEVVENKWLLSDK